MRKVKAVKPVVAVQPPVVVSPSADNPPAAPAVKQKAAAGHLPKSPERTVRILMPSDRIPPMKREWVGVPLPDQKRSV